MTKKPVVALTLFALTSVVYAQRKSSPRIGKATLDVNGIEVRLGMTKDEVTRKLAGNKITRVDDDNWLIALSGMAGPILQFKNGRLNYATRNWVTYDNEIAEALFGAINTLNQEGFHACTVTADTKLDPSMTSHRVWIDCGEKSVLLARDSFVGGKSHSTVDERLGNSN